MRPKTYIANEHDIDPRQIDADAIHIVQRLQEAGFTAYIVGGSVRDLLIQIKPKDYDISTSARPEEIKRIFGRQCLLIGRRFRLAHIRFRRKIFEVSTFRSGDNEDDLIVRDNQWGTEEEDVLRRDFTINGLFLNPTTMTVIDYVGGWEDIHNKKICSIGNPEIRFRQDPVRMIRLLKFRARLDFDVDPNCRDALIECRKEIVKSAPARILEEILRMLESGASARFMHLLHQSKILMLIFPKIALYIEQEKSEKMFELLSAADALTQTKESLHRAVLSSCLVFPMLEELIEERISQSQHPLNMGEILLITNSLLKQVIATSFTHFPKKLSTTMSYILSTQFRLHTKESKQKFRLRLLNNQEFSYALKFFKLRALINKELFDSYSHWQKLHSQQKKQRFSHSTRRHS